MAAADQRKEWEALELLLGRVSSGGERSLALAEGRLAFDIQREDGTPLESVILGLGRFRQFLQFFGRRLDL